MACSLKNCDNCGTPGVSDYYGLYGKELCFDCICEEIIKCELCGEKTKRQIEIINGEKVIKSEFCKKCNLAMTLKEEKLSSNEKYIKTKEQKKWITQRDKLLDENKNE